MTYSDPANTGLTIDGTPDAFTPPRPRRRPRRPRAGRWSSGPRARSSRSARSTPTSRGLIGPPLPRPEPRHGRRAPATPRTGASTAPPPLAGEQRADHRPDADRRPQQLPGAPLPQLRRPEHPCGRPRRASRRRPRARSRPPSRVDPPGRERWRRPYDEPTAPRRQARGRPHRRDLQRPRRSRSSCASDTDADTLRSRHRDGARPTATACCGSPTARAARSGVPVDKLAYVEIGSPDTERAASASAADPRRGRRCADAAMTDLLDRRLLFVTGKGGVGKTTVAAALALLARRSGASARCVVRGRRQGQPGRLLRDRPDRLRARARSQPGLCAMSMDTEESLKEYLQAPAAACPLLARIGPLARTFDFVANAAPGRQGDPHRRQVLLGGRGERPLRPRRGRRRRHRSRRSASSRAPQAIHELVQVGPGAQPDRLDARHPRRPGASPALVIVTTPEEMPVNETIELVGRLRERDRRRPRRRSSSTGCCPSCSAAPRRRCSSALRAAGARRRSSSTRSAAGVDAGPRRAPASRSRCGAPRAGHLDRLRARAARDLPLLYVPYLFARAPRPARHPHGRRGARRGAGLLMAERRARTRPARRSSSCSRPRRSSSAAARAASARRRPRRPRPRMAAIAARRQGARAHRRPGPAARQRARPRAVRQRRDAGARTRRSPPPGVEPRGELWAAMLDTKQSWDDLVRRHAPDEADRATHPRQPALPEHHRARSCRATTTSRWSGSTRSTRRARYDLIVVDTPPTRNAIDFLEAPDAHGRLLRRPAAALAHRCRTASRRASNVGVASPSTTWPTASSARSSSRTSPSSSSSSRRCTTASSSGPRRSTRTAARPAHDVRGGDARSSRRRCTRPSSSSTRSTTASFHLGALVLNKVLPRLPAIARRPRRSPARCAATPIALAEKLAERRRRPRRTSRRVLREVGRELPQLPGRGQARGRAARRAVRRSPTWWPPCPTSTPTSTTSPGLLALGGSDLALSLVACRHRYLPVLTASGA